MWGLPTAPSTGWEEQLDTPWEREMWEHLQQCPVGLFLAVLFSPVFSPPYFPQVLDPEVLKEDSGLQNLQASGESDFIAR